MTVFEFILASLACYRLTVLFARDAGPWGVFQKLRKITRLSKLLSCPFCVSIWLAAVIDMAFWLSGVRDSVPVMVSQILAMSAISICLDRMFTSDHLAK